MRLLKLESDDRFSLHTVSGYTTEYAILSHTWGDEEEEVTFQDIINGTGDRKAGYDKLRFCGRQAKADNLDYFWVDTCCIDKTNSTELQEAINSMFRFYSHATQCYVYLGDVLAKDRSEVDRESCFRKHRWFTRGWTLQELIAPKTVKFYSQDHVLLGDKDSLKQQIFEITGITIEALQGDSLHVFSIDERLRWAEKRKTTKEEDIVYCLLGIFDIFLPLIYGEGKKHAMGRLRRMIKESDPDSFGKTWRVSIFTLQTAFT
jgi:hypothetical protein